MSSLVITLTLEDTQAVLQQRLEKNVNNAREEAREVETLMKQLRGGQKSGIMTVQTGSSSPVAASGTFTLVTVVATDVANVGAVDFTFTATPLLETDVMVTVPSALAFASADISIVTGNIAETTHGYATGDVGRLTTSGTLPTGLSLSTDYFVIRRSADVYSLASSKANALLGAPIIPSAIGSGNHTFTVTINTYTASKLAAAINAHSTISQIVTASYAAGVVTVTAKQKGVVGNFIQISDADSTITTSGTGRLTGGTGGVTDAGVVYSLGL